MTARTHRPRASTPARRLALAFTLCLALGQVAVADDDTTAAGLGRYYNHPRGGIAGALTAGLAGTDPLPPAAPYRTGEAAAAAAPTNQWYTSVMFTRAAYPIYAHPLSYRATVGGFELGLPDAKLVTTAGSRREMRYPHVAAITVAPAAFQAREPRLYRHSDWLAEIRYAGPGTETLDVTVLHGSPFSYYELSTGDAHLKFAAAPALIADPRTAGQDPRVVAVTVGGHSYAVYAPTGAAYEWVKPTELVLHLPRERRYFSIAGLPDDRVATVADFARVAYAFPTETRATARYDEHAGTLATTFEVTTVAREGGSGTTFMGLYPHHWSAIAPSPAARYTYPTVRGRIRLIEANSFTTTREYRGFVPGWARLEDAKHRARVDSLLVGDEAKAGELYLKKGRGTYWIGKGLGATAQLMSIAEAEGKTRTRDALLAQLKDRLASWFDGRHPTYFLQDTRLGTFVGYPEEYASVTSMNDHHFHYGYWISAAAHVALRDPAWADDAHWGPMVGKLIADIATDERGRADFPYLRNFDPYEGHSWASGDAGLEDGNNQESSSEAVNAWAGLILWGEATGNQRVRDLGVYLYTTEIASIRAYWFDLDHEVLSPEFGKPFASMLFGGKYSYNTWWTEEPRQIMGINVVPLTPASTYLGANAEYLRSLYQFLPAEEKRYRTHGATDGTPTDIWQDVLSAHRALADPAEALKNWRKFGSVEFGETRSHTLYWLLSLNEMGPPDLGVGADTPLYAVFRDATGRRTYLAYNARSTPLHVTFTTGKTLDVAPHSLAREH